MFIFSVNYHMNLADAPEWYQQVWLQHQREVKKMDDNSIKRVLARYEDATAKKVNLVLKDESFQVPEPKGVIDLDAFQDEEISREEAQAQREKLAELLNGSG